MKLQKRKRVSKSENYEINGNTFFDYSKSLIIHLQQNEKRFIKFSELVFFDMDLDALVAKMQY